MIPGVVASSSGSRAIKWTPSGLVDGPSIWLNDESPVVEATGNVSTWGDISGNDFDFSQSLQPRKPSIVLAAVNGRRVIRFDGGSENMSPNSSGASKIYNGVGSAWMMVVAKKTGSDPSPTSRRIFLFEVATGPSVRFGFYGDDASLGNANKMVIGARRLDTGAYSHVSGSVSNDEWVMALAEVDYVSRTIKLHEDGVVVASKTGAFTGSGSTSSGDSRRVSIGGTPDGSLGWAGDLAEVMCGVGLPLPDEIDKLFGYCAHRWGLAAKLPAEHPYKDSAP